jgi:hypothetical protein
MTLRALEIPEDQEELAGWLEQHLLGLDLAALTLELEAVHGTRLESGPSLEELLGSRLNDLLEKGLSALPLKVLRQILGWPRLLLELQDLVVSRGGDYWDRVVSTSYELDQRVERGRSRLFEWVPRESGATEAAIEEDLLPIATGAWYLRPWFVALATAAAVLLMLTVVDYVFSPTNGQLVAASPAWGWSKPGALPQDLSAGAYLERLADDAEGWFQTRPDEPLALARRIAEFREGCSTLILSQHRPLTVDDRQWLSGKCREWATAIDSQLRAVEAGENPLAIRAETDQTIRKLVTALRARAKAAG